MHFELIYGISIWNIFWISTQRIIYATDVSLQKCDHYNASNTGILYGISGHTMDKLIRKVLHSHNSFTYYVFDLTYSFCTCSHRNNTFN